MDVTPDLIMYIIAAILFGLEAIDFKLGTSTIKLGWVGLVLVALALSALTP